MIGIYCNHPYKGVCVPSINSPETTPVINQKSKCKSRIGFLKATITPTRANTAAASGTNGVDSTKLYGGAKNALRASKGEYVKSLNRSDPRTFRILSVLAVHDSNIWNEAAPAARITAPKATPNGRQHHNRFPSRRLSADLYTASVSTALK